MSDSPTLKQKLEIPGIPPLQNMRAAVVQLIDLVTKYVDGNIGVGIVKIEPNDKGKQLSLVVDVNSSGGLTIQLAQPEPSITVLNWFSRDIQTLIISPDGITIDVEGAELTVPIAS